MKYSNPLWRTLCSLKGNQKACVFSEPLWAIPNNLFLPFASIYMAAVGLQDKQIGMIVSLGLAMQLIWGMFSGAIVNKYGRRKMILVFGLLTWTVPCLLWAVARGYLFFILAVFFNSMQQVISNCFNCLIFEDGDSEKLVNIWTILNLIGLFAGFISPIAGICIDRFTLVPTMRVIYTLSMVLMTIKFILQYCMSQESEEGKRCIKEYKGKSLLSLSFSGWGESVFALRQPRLLLCVILGALLTCFNNIHDTFWPLFVTKAYGVSDSLISTFSLVTSITSIVVFMLVSSRIKIHSIRYPLLVGMGLHALSLIILLAFLPTTALWAVFFSVICKAFALAVLNPLIESIMLVVVPENGRARINSLVIAVMLLISIPAGWIAGYLSQYNRALPMVMNLCFIFIGIIVSLFIVHVFQTHQKEEVLN
jgi:MFS family permease